MAFPGAKIMRTSRIITCSMGVVGGLPLMLLFIAILAKGFSYVGQTLRQMPESSPQSRFMIWALGASLFAHAATFISVSYFDQSFVFIYLTLAAIRLSPVWRTVMKILVAIANFGTKNAMYLEKLLDEYRSMARFSVDIVVFSNIPKDLGPDVEVIVGLPTKDPWSLPFGHKALFAERMQQYDLFIYSEDDTLITERNIDAFVKMTKILPEKYIAGFLRYEISEKGRKYYNDFHNHFHWDPNSVLTIGEYIFAYYTNEHSACFILTQGQLQKAINSGGFLLPPRKGRYDMLVTAATDPYTQCGLKKLICISHLDDFCIHHLPNVYIGKIGG